MKIPKAPEELHVRVEKRWNGEDCSREDLHASAWLSQTDDGVVIRVQALVLEDQKMPEAEVGARFDGLWDFDVVEVFLVGDNHHYLEVELGAGGQWLVLEFDEIRKRSNDHADLQPKFSHIRGDEVWSAEIVIPRDLVPEGFRGMCVFVIAGGKFLSLVPMPGDEPDFHQPDVFSDASLE